MSVNYDIIWFVIAMILHLTRFSLKITSEFLALAYSSGLKANAFKVGALGLKALASDQDT